MRVGDRYELAAKMREEYQASGRRGRGLLLDAFCLATGYNRRYAMAILAGQQLRKTESVRKTRERRYDERFSSALAVLWEASGYVCAERLQPWMPELLGLLEQHQQIEVDEGVKSLISRASVATVERALKPIRDKVRRTRMSQTRPGTFLRKQIPVVVGDWKKLDTPGYLEIDLVSHSGEHAAGSFLWTLSAVDIATGWSERIAIADRKQETVLEAMDRLRYLLPFEVLGIHPDNGNEFIGEPLLAWCRNYDILFTRGRPYRKNDNPHVEQKNWSLVRRHVGYERFDTEQEMGWLNHFYQDQLRIFANCFQPVMKLVGKEHRNGRTCRLYDIPTTPLTRLISSGKADAEKLERLEDLQRTVSPLTLKRQLDITLKARPTHQEDRLSA